MKMITITFETYVRMYEYRGTCINFTWTRPDSTDERFDNNNCDNNNMATRVGDTKAIFESWYLEADGWTRLAKIQIGN